MERTYDNRRAIEVRAARDLVDAARSERATLASSAREHDFYLGVEAAAATVLRPEAAMRDEGWLERESASFREGYRKTADLLAVASTRAEASSSLPLPRPSGQP